MKNISLLGLTKAELKQFVMKMGQPGFRGEQIFNWMWKKKILNPEEMTDLPERFRTEFGRHLNAQIPSVEKSIESEDRTKKFLIQLVDGYKIEFVLIPKVIKKTIGSLVAHYTLCISTQVGCRFGCIFCRSGREGLRRNLEPDEITAQLWLAEKFLSERGAVSEIVLMGIGEPFDNYPSVKQALKIFLDTGLSGSRIVVSTVGIPDGIKHFSMDFNGKICLALSLHSAIDEKRRKIIPKLPSPVPVREILEEAFNFVHPGREKLTIEIVLVNGLNDSINDAKQLAELLHRRNCKVNLIPVNRVYPLRFFPPSEKKLDIFRNVLLRSGILTFTRHRRGDTIKAACGQLAFSEN